MKLIYRKLVCVLLPHPKNSYEESLSVQSFKYCLLFPLLTWAGYLHLSATCKVHLQKNSFCFLKMPFFFEKKKATKDYHIHINQVYFSTEDYNKQSSSYISAFLFVRNSNQIIDHSVCFKRQRGACEEFFWTKLLSSRTDGLQA